LNTAAGRWPHPGGSSYSGTVRIVRTIARPLLVSVFIAAGLDVLASPEPRAKATKPVVDLAAMALAVSMVPTTIAGHRFWEIDDPAKRSMHRTHFLKNTAILGGLLVVALD
jgi:putative oxidoreductase